ncbi:hypothetical protein GCM10009838_21800 [Catenulispora subtropica]|uniref:Secreted protein n=1 Tax=Catenulispora subtropica TaxID=450798 RepID=A0ABN2R5X9_9ACTN
MSVSSSFLILSVVRAEPPAPLDVATRLADGLLDTGAVDEAVVAAPALALDDEVADAPTPAGKIFPDPLQAVAVRTAAASTAMETPLFAERMMISPSTRHTAPRNP